jgi:hypothetical protein
LSSSLSQIWSLLHGLYHRQWTPATTQHFRYEVR